MKKLGLTIVFSLVLIGAIVRLGFESRVTEAPTPVAPSEIPTKDTVVGPAAKAKPTAPKAEAAADELRLTTLTSRTLEKLQREPEPNPKRDSHYSRPGLFDTSREFGEIADRLQKDSSAIPEGVDFYRACATDERVMVPIRAVCLRNLRYWSNKAQPQIPVNDTEFPDRLHELARALPSVP